MFALFLEFDARSRPQDLWPFLISETGLKFLYEPEAKFVPVNRGSCLEALKRSRLQWLYSRGHIKNKER